MSINYLPIIEDALVQMVAFEQQRLSSTERGADFVFGQFGQLCILGGCSHGCVCRPQGFACIFVGGVFETAFYATLRQIGDNEWVSLLISVPFVLEATCACEASILLDRLINEGVAQRELLRMSQDRNSAHSDLYHLAAGAICSQSDAVPLWQQQAHTFYAQAFAKVRSESGVCL